MHRARASAVAFFVVLGVADGVWLARRALIGFGLFGAGLSCTFPQLLSAAGNMTSFPPGRGIARVAGTGYAGFLCGPVLIGGLASLVGLRLAFAVPVILMLAVALGGAAARPADGPAPAGSVTKIGPAAAGSVMESREADAGRRARRPRR